MSSYIGFDLLDLLEDLDLNETNYNDDGSELTLRQRMRQE